MDFNNIDDIIGGFNKILKLTTIGGPQSIPTILIFTGVPQRSGLSPTKVATKIISRKAEAGLPVGVLPSGVVSPDEMMWRIAVEEIFKALQEDAVISVAIPDGIALTASGIGPSGPVTVAGETITMAKGYGVIQ
jgi:hypothetical protein